MFDRSIEHSLAILFYLLAGMASLALIAQLFRPVSKIADELEAVARKAGLAVGRSAENDFRRAQICIGLIAERLDCADGRSPGHHPTTGLPTREPFLTKIASLIALRQEPTVLALVRLCDFDRIIEFDRSTADTVLRAFGERIKTAVSSTVLLAQVDRDCFALWFGGANPTQAVAELRAIAYVLEQALIQGERRISPEVALGAAVFPDDATDAPALMSCACAALAQAGRSAHGKPIFFSSASSQAARRRFLIEQGLRTAPGREGLTLNYQPVVHLPNRRIVGAEALLRWSHTELGALSPSEFVPILEESGLINEVGAWVLDTACREARNWREQGFVGVKVAVNLSACQFQERTLAMTVARTLERRRLRPEDLEIELTETAAMQDVDRTQDVLRQLRTLGVSVAIDDFGAGYSNLNYLKNLPITKLKIDREFVTKVDERRESRAICTALVALSSGLGIDLLAEGVEERTEVDALAGLGCDLFQGYYFGKPLSAAAFSERLAEGVWPHGLEFGSSGRAPGRQLG